MDHHNKKYDSDLIGLSYEVTSDANAFNDLLNIWQQKLNIAFENDLRNDTDLQSHVARAARLLETSSMQTFEDPVDEILSNQNAPTLVLSETKYILGANFAWRQKFNHQEGQQVSDDWLLPNSVDTYREIEKSIFTGKNTKHGIVRARGINDRAMLAEVFPILSRQSGKEVVAVRILEPEWSPSVSARLSEVFGLTEAECDVCRLLFEFRETAQIAEARGTAVRTVRLQLASIFDKTEVQNQVDLVRLLSITCARIFDSQQQSPKQSSAITGQEKEFWSRNRRKLSYNWFGAPDGVPTILLHGTAMGATLPREADSYFASKGIKVHALFRPSFHTSQFSKGKPPLEDNADAILELADELGLENFHLVCVTISGAEGCRFARNHPERVESVLFLSGFYCWNTPNSRDHFMPAQRTFLELAQRAPWAARMLAMAGARVIQQKGYDWYLEQLYAHSPRDLEIRSDPTILTLLRNSVRYLTAQGGEAFYRDLLIEVNEAGYSDLAKLTCPIHLAQGSEDERLRPHHLEEFFANAPDTKHHLIEGAGQLLYYSNWKDVCDLMKSIVQSG